MNDAVFTTNVEAGEDGRRPPELVLGVEYDYAGDIDERNGWKEPGEKDDAADSATITLAAAGLMAFIRFCFPSEVNAETMVESTKRICAVSHAWGKEHLRNVSCHNKKTAGREITLAELAQFCGSSEEYLQKLQADFKSQWLSRQ